MIRTQIELSEEQATALREIAAGEGRSVADVIRESVDVVRGIEARSFPHRPKRSGNRDRRPIPSGLADLGKRHDPYLTEDPE